MKHKNVLGAGAEKRRKLPTKERGAVIAKEFERGTLHSGSGKIVKDEAQMKAIIWHETHPDHNSHERRKRRHGKH